MLLAPGVVLTPGATYSLGDWRLHGQRHPQARRGQPDPRKVGRGRSARRGGAQSPRRPHRSGGQAPPDPAAGQGMGQEVAPREGPGRGLSPYPHPLPGEAPAHAEQVELDPGLSPYGPALRVLRDVVPQHRKPPPVPLPSPSAPALARDLPRRGIGRCSGGHGVVKVLQMAAPPGLEPGASRLGGGRSVRLS